MHCVVKRNNSMPMGNKLHAGAKVSNAGWMYGEWKRCYESPDLHPSRNVPLVKIPRVSSVLNALRVIGNCVLTASRRELQSQRFLPSQTRANDRVIVYDTETTCTTWATGGKGKEHKKGTTWIKYDPRPAVNNDHSEQCPNTPAIVCSQPCLRALP